MLHGVLITNAFLRTDKFVEHYEWLKKAAWQYQIALSLLENTDLLYQIPAKAEDNFSGMDKILSDNDFVLYWDKDIPQGNILTSLCQKRGIPIFNSIDAIRICDNKFETYQKIWEWNQSCAKEEQIPILPTIMAPMTYDNIGYSNLDFIEPVIQKLGLPLIIKECYGSFGMQVYLADSRSEVCQYTKNLGGKRFIYQKYLAQSTGKDVRLQVVGNKVVAAMYRSSKKGDFRANITNGGSMKPYNPSKEECELAVRTLKVLGLDFAGVDLLFSKGENGTADILCEVNSNAHFKNIFTCTGVNVADFIMRYIAEQMLQRRENG